MARNQRASRPPAAYQPRAGSDSFVSPPGLDVAQRISLRPVSEWKDALAAVPADERDAVRAFLVRWHEAAKEHAALDREIAERRAVWMSIPKGFKA
jgi:hypothetical protein